MSASTPLFKVCSQDPGVTALLGTDPVRLYPWGEAPQGVAKPYATYQGAAGAPETTSATGRILTTTVFKLMSSRQQGKALQTLERPSSMP